MKGIPICKTLADKFLHSRLSLIMEYVQKIKLTKQT